MRFYMLILAVLSTATAQLGGLDSIFGTTTVKIYTAGTTTTPRPVTTTQPTAAGLPIECDTDDNRRGFCMDRHLCINNTIAINGVNLKPRKSNPCPLLQECCAMESSNKKTTTAPTVISSTTSSSVPTVSPVRSSTDTKGCGWRNIDAVGGRAMGGTTANFGEFPWAVPIFKIEDNKEMYICGGSLIHPRLILTYATRFTRGGQFVARPGDYDILENYEILGHQTIEVIKIIPHKQYNSGGMFNNIAILVLKDEVKLAAHIGYACLPSSTTRPAPGTQCIATGWGADKEINGTIRNLPKMVQMPVVASDVCQDTLREHTGPQYNLHGTIMCVGGIKDEDTCKGDGGSPLVCPYPGEKNRYYQAGIVSWGLYCGMESVPSMYTDVAVLRPWIDDTVRAEGFNTNYYTP